MFQSIPVFEENIFAYKVTGKLTKEDYDDFLPKLTTLIHKYGSISLLLELEDFHGLEAKAMWEDYKFATVNDKNFKKIAIVGDSRWTQWMTVLSNVFTNTDLRYFQGGDASAAWDWLRDSGEEQQAANDEAKDNIEPYRHILATTDYSPHSEKALRRAQELAKEYGAQLSIIHVLERLGYYEESRDIMMAVPEAYNDTDQIIFKNSEKRLDELKMKLGLKGVSSEVLWGTPKTTILSYAEAQKVDLIVMGSHGRRGFSKLIGSTTNGVINHAKCEVLSVNIGHRWT